MEKKFCVLKSIDIKYRIQARAHLFLSNIIMSCSNDEIHLKELIMCIAIIYLYVHAFKVSFMCAHACVAICSVIKLSQLLKLSH